MHGKKKYSSCLVFLLLVFMFQGCLLVEGFVAVRRFRQAEDVLVDDFALVIEYCIRNRI